MRKIRTLCQDRLPQHEESIVYNMPSYTKNGQVQVAFASQKQHLTLYFLIHEVMLRNKNLLEGMNVGKGCIRYSDGASINYDLITKLLDETAASTDTIC
ncbi:MAG: DUF1801 domain-containing protein [Saprospiraceae bacterium]|nr:DUF1801 domain-containing protein [Saprospiraceae bacterium]